MSRLYLIRHGEPTSGWGDAAGSADPGLSERGRAQAEAAADMLSALPEVERPRRVLTSPLRRCQETAAPFAARLGVTPTITPAVAEIATPEGVAQDARAAWLREAMQGEWATITGINGEAWRAGVVDALLTAEGAAVFSHFVAINAAVTAVTGSLRVLAFRPAPGSVTTLDVESGRLKLVSLGGEVAGEGRVL